MSLINKQVNAILLMLPSLLTTIVKKRTLINKKNDKYQKLRVDKARMWHKNAKVMPVVIWVLGLISYSLGNHLKNISISPDITRLQNFAILGTAHIL